MTDTSWDIRVAELSRTFMPSINISESFSPVVLNLIRLAISLLYLNLFSLVWRTRLLVYGVVLLSFPAYATCLILQGIACYPRKGETLEEAFVSERCTNLTRPKIYMRGTWLLLLLKFSSGRCALANQSSDLPLSSYQASLG